MNIHESKHIVDILNEAKVIEKILDTMDHGFGEVNFKVTVQNGAIRVISVTDTQTVKIV